MQKIIIVLEYGFVRFLVTQALWRYSWKFSATTLFAELFCSICKANSKTRIQAAAGFLTYLEVLLEFFDMILMSGSGEEDSVAGSGCLQNQLMLFAPHDVPVKIKNHISNSQKYQQFLHGWAA